MLICYHGLWSDSDFNASDSMGQIDNTEEEHDEHEQPQGDIESDVQKLSTVVYTMKHLTCFPVNWREDSRTSMFQWYTFNGENTANNEDFQDHLEVFNQSCFKNTRFSMTIASSL